MMITKTLLLMIATLLGLAFGQQVPDRPSPPATTLAAPATGKLRVAFVVTEGAVMIDFTGPWEVFQDVMIPSRGASMHDQHVFELYTVSDSKKPIRVSGGMQIVPDYTFEDAPDPGVVVVPAQDGNSPKMMDWLRRMATKSDVVMSVCAGSFQLGEAGLLKGRKATTHHSAYEHFQKRFPDVQVQRDVRYVQSDRNIFTSGGLSSGIDLALHVVELYFGRSIAASTARVMEYEGTGWMGDGASKVKYSEPAVVSSPADRFTTGVRGTWDGRVTAKESSLRMAVHIWPDTNGALTGTVDSLDEDVYGLAIASITESKSGLHFGVPGIEGTYDGKLDAHESTIVGTWTQPHASVPLTLTRRK